MNVGVTPDENGHYVVEAYLPDREHAGYSKYQPLRKFMAQGDAMLFAYRIRNHQLSTPAELYARTYNAKNVVKNMSCTRSGNYRFEMVKV